MSRIHPFQMILNYGVFKIQAGLDSFQEIEESSINVSLEATYIDNKSLGTQNFPQSFTLNTFWKTAPHPSQGIAEAELQSIVQEEFTLKGPQGDYTVHFYLPSGQFTEEQIQSLLKITEDLNFLLPQEPLTQFRWDTKKECGRFLACYTKESKPTAYYRIQDFKKTLDIFGRNIGHHLYVQKGYEKNELWNQVAQALMDSQKLLIQTSSKGTEHYQNFLLGDSYYLKHKDWLFARTVDLYYSRADEFAHKFWQLTQEDIPQKYKDAVKNYWNFIEQEVFAEKRFTTHQASPFDLYSIIKAMTKKEVTSGGHLDEWFFSYSVEERAKMLEYYWSVADTKERWAFLEKHRLFWQKEEIANGTALKTLLSFVDELQSLWRSKNLEEYKIEARLDIILLDYLPNLSIFEDKEGAEELIWLFGMRAGASDTNLRKHLFIDLILRLFEDGHSSLNNQVTYKSFDFKQKAHLKIFVDLCSMSAVVSNAADQALEKLISPEDLSWLILAQRAIYDEFTRNYGEILRDYGAKGILCGHDDRCETLERMKWLLNFMESHPKYHTPANLRALEEVITREEVFSDKEEIEVKKLAIQTYGSIAGTKAIPLLRKIRTEELGKARLSLGQLEWQKRGLVKMINQTIQEIRRSD